MTVTIELFYSPTCPHCPRAKEVLHEVLENVNQEIHLDEVNILSLDGLKRAEKYGIMAVPALIINMRHKIVGVPAKDRLFRLINGELTEKEQVGSERNEAHRTCGEDPKA